MDVSTLLIGAAVIVAVPVIAIKVSKLLRHRKAVRRRLVSIRHHNEPLFPRVADAVRRQRPELVRNTPCYYCDGLALHDPNCPFLILTDMTRFHSGGIIKRSDISNDEVPVILKRGEHRIPNSMRKRFIAVEPDHGVIESDTPIHPLQATPWDEEGEPLKTPPPPNLGGEGNPEYQGPHYDSVHGLETRFAQYDLLREPPEGAAVYTLGQAAAFGPIPKGESDDADSPGPD